MGARDDGIVATPANPFDPGSGRGVFSEGSYQLIVAFEAPDQDRDCFLVELRAGDVLSATVGGSAVDLAVESLDRGLLVASRGTDLSGVYPPESPSSVVVTQPSPWSSTSTGRPRCA